jgi:hypothetical protein
VYLCSIHMRIQTRMPLHMTSPWTDAPHLLRALSLLALSSNFEEPGHLGHHSCHHPQAFVLTHPTGQPKQNKQAPTTP